MRKDKKTLEWWVYIENFNSSKIEPYNIFNHSGFQNSLFKNKEAWQREVKKYRKDNPDATDLTGFAENYKDSVFKEAVKRDIMYYFWSKCEWEVVITDWPTFMSSERLIKQAKEIEQDKCQKVAVDLLVEEKIDVAAQVFLNFSVFIDYLWDNLSLISSMTRKGK